MENLHDTCLNILEDTNDGEDLDPQDLALVELALNQQLDEPSLKLIEGLEKAVREGYKKPWFHGIENLTINTGGYVFWREAQIDHFTLTWAFTTAGEKSAKRLAEQCRVIEAAGQRVTPAMDLRR